MYCNVLATERKCLHAFDFIIAFVVENARDPECHAPRIAAGSAENEKKSEINAHMKKHTSFNQRPAKCHLIECQHGSPKRTTISTTALNGGVYI